MPQRIVLYLLLFISALNIQAQTEPEIYRKIVVDQNGEGDFQTIQAAINSCRDFGPNFVLIEVKKGIYNEKIVIPSWKTKIYIKGDSSEDVIIRNNDHSGKEIECSQKELNTFTSYTFQVLGNDIFLDNLSIENESCNEGQAVALHVEGDRFVIRNSNVKGCQDTLYTATENSRQLYENCYLEGTTDFIFGAATAVFKNCTIKSLSNSYITAASTTKGKEFGFVFLNCEFTAGENADNVYLGRPWRPYAKTVIINSELGEHIRSEGWNPWKGDEMFPNKEESAYYAEYNNTGLGAASDKRVEWSHQLNDKEAERYTLKNIFGQENHWHWDFKVNGR